jgi:excisionase family DNA binding protein
MTKIEIPSVPTISVPAAGRLLGLGRDASYRAAAEGRIPVLQFGRLKRVPTAALRKMLGLAAEADGAAA